MRVGVPQFPVFLLAGLLPWTLISVSITGVRPLLLNNQGLIRKVAVPQTVYPLAVVASKLVDLLLSLVPLALLALALGAPPGPAGSSWSRRSCSSTCFSDRAGAAVQLADGVLSGTCATSSTS